jgi:hypothetical protein
LDKRKARKADRLPNEPTETPTKGEE